VEDTLPEATIALVLKSELEERIAGLGRSGSWPEIIADLDSLVALPPTVRDAAAS